VLIMHNAKLTCDLLENLVKGGVPALVAFDGASKPAIRPHKATVAALHRLRLREGQPCAASHLCAILTDF